MASACAVVDMCATCFVHCFVSISMPVRYFFRCIANLSGLTQHIKKNTHATYPRVNILKLAQA